VVWLSVREDLSVLSAGRSPREELLSPSGVSIRELDCSRGVRRLSACCLVEVETDGVLLLIKSPMRERDWSRLVSELAAEELPACPPDAGGPCCSLLEMRERRSELRVWEFEPIVLSDVSDLSDLSDPVVIRPPIRDLASVELVRLVGFESAAPAWSLPAMPDCAAVGADGLVVAGTPIVELSDLLDLSDLVVIEPPIREVKSELIRLLEPVPRPFVELDTDGVRVLIGLPIREVKSELIRPLEFVFPTWPLALRLEPPRLELGDEDLPAPKELEDGDEMLDAVGDLEVVAGMEFMLPGLRVDPNVLGRDDTEAPGLTTLLELVGGCTDREMLLEGRLIRLELDRPIDGELAGARLMLGGALTLGAGAGAGLETCRLAAELPAPELELFRSALSPKTGPQSRIKTEMSARIPILARRPVGPADRYSIANMICLLSANGSNMVSTLTTKGRNLKSGNENISEKQDFFETAS